MPAPMRGSSPALFEAFCATIPAPCATRAPAVLEAALDAPVTARSAALIPGILSVVLTKFLWAAANALPAFELAACLRALPAD